MVEGSGECGWKGDSENAPYDIYDSDLYKLNPDEALQEVMKLRKAIRYHRDQKGDNRCWLDDIKLYENLPETVKVELELPPKEAFLGSCTKFWECRQGKKFANADDCYEKGSYYSLDKE